jgi:hypothetical protein
MKSFAHEGTDFDADAPIICADEICLGGAKQRCLFDRDEVGAAGIDANLRLAGLLRLAGSGEL